jgi:hypothetical protein
MPASAGMIHVGVAKKQQLEGGCFSSTAFVAYVSAAPSKQAIDKKGDEFFLMNKTTADIVTLPK